MKDFIRTKQLYEYKKGQLIGLGFGNIVQSDADIVCISAFDKPSFAATSSIGLINELLKAKANINLEQIIDAQFKSDGFQLFDFTSNNLSFKKILLISMGC